MCALHHGRPSVGRRWPLKPGCPPCAQVATRPVAGLDPRWDEVLVLEVPESDLESEKLLLGVVNHASQRLAAKAAVPLRGLAPGRHYNLALELEAGGRLFVSLCLLGAPRTQLALARAQPGMVRIEAAVAAVQPPPGTEALYAEAMGASSSSAPPLALPACAVQFYLVSDGTAARVAPPPRALALWEPADASSESSVSAAALRR